MQVVIVIALFWLFSPSLVFVGISYILAAILSVFILYVLSRKEAPYIHISLHDFRLSRLKDVCGQAFWGVLLSVGMLLIFPISIVIANKMFGEIAGTQFSICVVMCNAIMGLSALITSTFMPQIYLYRVMDEVDSLSKFCASSMKIVGLGMSLPVSLLCVYAPIVLSLWVGEEFIEISPMISVMIIPMIFRMMASCIGPINAAYLKVKQVALMYSVIGILNTVLAIILPSIFHNGIYGIGLACMISTTIGMGLFEPIYNAYILKKSRLFFLKPLIFVLPTLFIFIILLSLLGLIVEVSSLLSLIIVCIVVSPIYLEFIIHIMLTKEERSVVRRYMPKFLTKIIPKWII